MISICGVTIIMNVTFYYGGLH